MTRDPLGRYSSATREVLRVPAGEAFARNHTYLGTEHILLALAATDDDLVAVRALRGLEQWRRLVGGLAWLGCCDVATVSYELGFGKPNPAIYRHCLGELGLPACDVLFVDDRSENIATANELGLHTALFTDVERLRDDLSARFAEELPLP